MNLYKNIFFDRIKSARQRLINAKMATRPSLWIVLMSLMSFAYCDNSKFSISLSRSKSLDKNENNIEISIIYGNYNSNQVDEDDNFDISDSFSGLAKVPKGRGSTITMSNKDVKFFRTELYVSMFWGDYRHVSEHRFDTDLEGVLETSPEYILVTVRSWFPSGSDIVEFYLNVDRGNKEAIQSLEILYLRFKVTQTGNNIKLYKSLTEQEFNKSTEGNKISFQTTGIKEFNLKILLGYIKNSKRITLGTSKGNISDNLENRESLDILETLDKKKRKIVVSASALA